MFGMLDYRAHKLYIILFGIPNLLLLLFSLFGLPFAYYEVGKNYTDSHFMQIIVSLVALIVIELFWAIFVTYLSKFYIFLFGLLVDVIPAEGRTIEEARLVVWNGEKAINLINFSNKKPCDWTDEEIENLTTGFFNSFYREKIMVRISKIRDYYTENPKLIPNEWNTNQFLKKEKMERDILEKIVTEPLFRVSAIRYCVFLYLILFN